MNELKHISAIEKLEGVLLDGEHFELLITHEFTENEYIRTMYAPKGTIVVGHEHNQDTVNFMLSGRAIVRVGDELKEIRAPFKAISKPGIRKAAFVLEDMVWVNVHANPHGVPKDKDDEKRILGLLEEHYITKSQTFLDHEANALRHDILDLIEKEDAA